MGRSSIEKYDAETDTLSSRYATKLDQASATVLYIGEAEVGTLGSVAKWRIKRLTESGNATTIEWADGNTKNDNIWDSRNVLSYS